MSLTRPIALWLLLFLPLLGFLERRRIAGLLPAVRAVWGPLASASWRKRRIRAALLRAVSVLALIAALAGPVSGSRAFGSWTTGQDIVLLLDVSRSMNVAEGGSTRLERARREARSIMDRLSRARYALAVFKGSAMTVFPMTDDWDTIDEFLDSAGAHLMTDKGSDLEAGIAEALRAFRTKGASARAIVILSDGESLKGKPERAAEAARAAGIPVHAIGLGGDQGVPVPELPDARSKRDRAGLKRVCQASGGLYADEENRAAVRAMIERLESPFSPRGGRSVSAAKADVSAPFIFLACLALALSAVAGRYPDPARRGRDSRAKRARGKSAEDEGAKAAARAGRRRFGSFAAASIVLCALSGCARLGAVFSTADAIALASRGEQSRAAERFLATLPRVSGADADALRYDLGLCYQAMGEGEAALDLARRAASSKRPEVAARSWYALGCFLFMQAEYRQAWEAFKECLKLEPGSRDAQANLELAWERIEREGGAAPREAAALRGRTGLEGEREEYEIIRQAESGRYRNAREEEAGPDASDY